MRRAALNAAAAAACLVALRALRRRGLLPAAAAAFVLYWQRYYNRVVRGKLGDKQAQLYRPGDVHVITALAARSVAELPARVRELIGEVRRAGGAYVSAWEVVGVGELTYQMPQEQQAAVQAVLVTQWPSSKAYDAFHSTLVSASSPWSVAFSTGYKRYAAPNWLLPLAMGLLRLVKLLPWLQADLDPVGSKTDFVDAHHGTLNALKGQTAGYTPEQTYDWYTAFARDCEGEPARGSEPMVWWSWVRNGTDKEQRQDNKYALGFMANHAQHGGGLLDLGVCTPGARLRSEPASFDAVVGVYWPSRAFTGRLLRSRWMHLHGTGKCLGDTTFYATVPLFPNGVAADGAAYEPQDIRRRPFYAEGVDMEAARRTLIAEGKL